MTTHLVTQPLTVRAVLFGGTAEYAAAALTQRLDRAGVRDATRRATGGLSRVAQQEVQSQITSLANQVLAADVVDLIAAGWRKHRELTIAAKSTVAAPDKTMFVDLYSHRITSTRDWTVDIIVAEIPVASIDFTLTVTFDIEPIFAIVRFGRLVGLRGGQCVVHAALDVQHDREPSTPADRSEHPNSLHTRHPAIPTAGAAASPALSSCRIVRHHQVRRPRAHADTRKVILDTVARRRTAQGRCAAGRAENAPRSWGLQVGHQPGPQLGR